MLEEVPLKGSTADEHDPESCQDSAKDLGKTAEDTAAQGMQGGEKDTHIVAWDGPDDPKNPRNWSKAFRMTHVLLVSAFTLYSNLAATMFAPGAAFLIEEFHVTSSIVGTMTVTIYLLGFSFGPLILAPMSELYGRLPIYHLANLVYIGFTIGCALSTNITMFLVFRFFCGSAASAPLTIGAGTVADVIPARDRGKAMAIYGTGPLLGPVVGPIVGGFVAEYIGWRWTFWIICIMACVFSLIAVFVMRETNEEVLLSKKAARLRKATGEDFRARTDKGLTSRQLLGRAIIRPAKMLIFSPIVFLLSLYGAFVFGLIFLLFATFPDVFEETYGFGPGVSGLAYLGLGIGMIVGLVLFGLLSDKMMNKKRGGNDDNDGAAPRPEMRLPLMIWVPPIIPVGFFWYGWSAQAHTHWIVPILGTSLIGLGSFFIVMPAQTYFVDIFGAQGAASALAANSVVRNISGAFLGLAAPPLYANLGLGWGNSLLGFLCLAFVPIPFLFYRYGEWLRVRFAVEL
ncbi:putative transporter mfs2 [Phialemonium atrogriseum]|uniref:Transporter mfs2 n=1 Tax=Phialemonium atrogriseum TaxID=1093897 RepID=A0AAJ0CAY0_9PEZI|nr:putative transporter mfs2 [Phialemonium atrogriseum]KAK1771937.1 putative transporter mfs2 [Phialemonium atrogriseum]